MFVLFILIVIYLFEISEQMKSQLSHQIQERKRFSLPSQQSVHWTYTDPLLPKKIRFFLPGLFLLKRKLKKNLERRERWEAGLLMSILGERSMDIKPTQLEVPPDSLVSILIEDCGVTKKITLLREKEGRGEIKIKNTNERFLEKRRESAVTMVRYFWIFFLLKRNEERM